MKIFVLLVIILFANKQSHGKCIYADKTSITALPVFLLATPIIGTTTPTCAAAGTASIINYNAANIYTFNPAGPTVSTGGAINNLIAGTSYTVTAGTGGFTSAPSGAFSISPPLAMPSAPIINVTTATCTGAGTATITNYSAAIIYAFTPTGPTFSAGGYIIGITPGISYVATVVASQAFSIQASTVVASRPTVITTAATCTTGGTATITNYNSSAVYAFFPTGPMVSPGGAIQGMITGTSYTVAATDGGCTTLSSEAFCISEILPIPSAPVINTTGATCEDAGTATIINFNNANSYTFIPAGPTVSATGSIDGMNPGAGYAVTAGNGACTAASGTFIIQAPLSNALVPVIKITDATCVSASKAIIANYNPNAIYTFSPAGPTVQPGGAINDLIIGPSYTVTATVEGCTSSPSTVILILMPFANAPVPAITIIAAACGSGGAAYITNYSEAATYTFNPAGPTVSTGGAMAGLIAGTNYTVTENLTGCTATTVSSSFSIQPPLTIIAAPTINSTAATCTSGGAATITNYNAAVTYIFNPAGPSVSSTGSILETTGE